MGGDVFGAYESGGPRGASAMVRGAWLGQAPGQTPAQSPGASLPASMSAREYT